MIELLQQQINLLQQLKLALISLIALLTFGAEEPVFGAEHFGEATSTPVVVIDYSVRDELKADVALNAKVEQVMTFINASQSNYLSENGKYWQGIKTHNVTPIRGVSSAINLNIKSDNQKESLADLGFPFNNLPFSVEPQQYKILMPDRSVLIGYQVLFKIVADGEGYIKSVNSGTPIATRTFNWRYLDGNKIQ